MKAEEFVVELQKRGLGLTLSVDGVLYLTGPREARTEKIREYIRRQKTALKAHLATATASPVAIADPTPTNMPAPARDIEDSAPRPDDYTGPVPEAVWEVVKLNPLVYGAAQGWEIIARLGESLQFGEGATKEIALAAFAENIASDPFLTPSESAAFQAAWGAETARLESETAQDDAPELTQPNAAFGRAETEAVRGEVVPAATAPAPVGVLQTAPVVPPGPVMETVSGDLESLLEWRGTTAGPSMPPIAFVDDVDGFWREYNARRCSTLGKGA